MSFDNFKRSAEVRHSAVFLFNIKFCIVKNMKLNDINPVPCQQFLNFINISKTVKMYHFKIKVSRKVFQTGHKCHQLSSVYDAVFIFCFVKFFL